MTFWVHRINYQQKKHFRNLHAEDQSEKHQRRSTLLIDNRHGNDTLPIVKFKEIENVQTTEAPSNSIK